MLKIRIQSRFEKDYKLLRKRNLPTEELSLFLIKLKDVFLEYKEGNRKAIIIVSVLDGVTSLVLLRAYQLQSITLVAPLCSLKTILNVFAAHIFLKENDSLMKKIIAALLVLLGVTLINI